jgi:Tfp pilus assembly protein PilF
MSPDEPAILKIGPGQRGKEGKIHIRSVGRVKTALELRRERRAVCLSHLQEAQRLANKGEKDLANEQFEEAVAIEPENQLALLGFGVFLLSIDRPVLAERYLRRGVAVETASKGVKSLLYGNLGLSLFRQGVVQDAVKAYQSAIAINDENLSAYNNLAIAFKRLGKRELAKRTYSRLLVVESKSAMGYYGLGLLNDEDDRLDEAVFHYSRFLVLAGRRHEDLQESVKKRVDALKAKRENKKKRKFIHRGRYVP